MMAELYITNGSDRIDLLAGNRGLKGGAALTEMRLASLDRQTGRATETYELTITGKAQAEAIRYQQDLIRLLEHAYEYFADIADRPAWIVSRANGESGARYAVLYGGQPDNYGDIYSQPFAAGRGTYQIIVQLERGPWLANPPLTPALTAITNETRWTPDGNAWAALEDTVSNSTYSFTNTTTGLCTDDAWSWEYSDDDGNNWTEFATTENPTYAFADNNSRLVRLTATCTTEVESDSVIKAIS